MGIQPSRHKTQPHNYADYSQNELKKILKEAHKIGIKTLKENYDPKKGQDLQNTWELPL